MKKFDVKDHEPSILPDGEWKLVWADEFDGTELDRTKWDFRLNFFRFLTTTSYRVENPFAQAQGFGGNF